ARVAERIGSAGAIQAAAHAFASSERESVAADVSRQVLKPLERHRRNDLRCCGTAGTPEQTGAVAVAPRAGPEIDGSPTRRQAQFNHLRIGLSKHEVSLEGGQPAGVRRSEI